MFARRSALDGWLLSLPALAIFATFFLGPALIGAFVSLHRWNGSSPQLTFVGLANYAELVRDARFWNAVWVTLAMYFSMVLVKLPLALMVAVGLSKLSRGAKVYRAALFVPYMLSTTTVAIIWIFLFDPYQGLVNQLLQEFGLDDLQQGWLGDASTALPAIIAGGIWWTFGLYVVLFTAALAAIPQDYYDAARLETRSSWKILTRVTIPLLREQLFSSTVLVIGGVLGYMTGFILLLTGGGPSGRTETLGIVSHSLAFRALDFGRASAVSVLALMLVFALIIVPTVRIARTRVEFR